MDQSLRGFIDLLTQRSEVIDIAEPIDLDYVLPAVLGRLEAGPAVRFSQVRGNTMPVVGNLVSRRDRIALALAAEPSEISSRLLDAVANPIPTVEVTEAECQQVVEPVDLAALPIPRFFEKETGPYITAGVILVQDVVSGERNASFARFKVLDGKTAMLGVSPNHHLGKMAARALDAGKDLPISVAIGSHPAVMLAACLYLGFGDDELECAGCLFGEPLEVVRSIDSDVLVPAASEIILEGVIKPAERATEGLVSEFHGRYHDYGQGYIVEFTTMTRRQDAVFQVIVPGLHQEHVLLGAVSIAAGLESMLQGRFGNVAGVAVPDTGAGRTSAIVALRDPREGQAREVIEACFGAVKLIKQVVVVDEAVDPWNVDAVEWARLSHARPERDFLIIPDAPTDRSDPLVRDLKVGKLGVDATAKRGERVEGWDFAVAPAAAVDEAIAVLQRSEAVEQRSPLLRGLGYR